MTEEKQELIPLETQFPVLKADLDDFQAMVHENLGDDGIGRFELERIKVGAGGAPGYVIEPPGEDPQTVMSFEAIVVHQHGARTYYKEDVGEGDTQPDCSSEDGQFGQGDHGRGRGVWKCDGCPQAEWGSGKGNAQACKQQKAVYLYRQGSENVFPSMLLLPPTSLKNWRNYGTSLLGRQKRLSTILHKFSTEGDVSGDGKKFTKVVVRDVRALEKIDLVGIASLAEAVKGLVRAKSVELPRGQSHDDRTPSQARYEGEEEAGIPY